MGNFMTGLSIQSQTKTILILIGRVRWNVNYAVALLEKFLGRCSEERFEDLSMPNIQNYGAHGWASMSSYTDDSDKFDTMVRFSSMGNNVEVIGTKINED
jgi:hypothetical protein